MLTPLIVHRIIAPAYEQPIYNTQIVQPGETHLEFFTKYTVEPDNFCKYGCYLPYPYQFKIKRIACLNSCSNLQGFQEIMRKATFKLDLGQSVMFEAPAALTAWANLKEVTAVLKSISKLSQEQQQLILNNLRIASGHKLEVPIDLICQQNIRASLNFEPLKSPRPVTITCLLGGTKQRESY